MSYFCACGNLLLGTSLIKSLIKFLKNSVFGRNMGCVEHALGDQQATARGGAHIVSVGHQDSVRLDHLWGW